MLGTDNLGRDVLSRLLAGAPVSVFASLLSVGIGLVLGVIPGLLSVFLDRKVEWLSLRLIDAIMTLPFLVFAIAMTALLGNGLIQAMFAVGLLVTPSFYRVSRGRRSFDRQHRLYRSSKAAWRIHTLHTSAPCAAQSGPFCRRHYGFGDRHVPVGCCVADVSRHRRRAA